MLWVIRTSLRLSDSALHTTGPGRHYRKRCRLAAGIIVGLLILNGCASFSIKKWQQNAAHLPIQHELRSVPFYPQEKYQCGPASLAMALSWSGLQITPDALTPQVFTPSLKGSLQPALVAAARRHGRVAYEISGANALLREIAAGHPVIVLQNLGLSWIPVWHYAVVIGYDLSAEVIILHSGTTDHKITALRTFENTWSRGKYWGLVVLPPDRLPATAEKSSYVEAVVGLERSGQLTAAIAGYKTALSRWPQSFSAHIGLSNSYYKLGDLKSAEEVLQKTTRRFPEQGDGFNNLAQVLWEQGKKKEALKAARHAVKLGGPRVEQYQKTLEEIQADTQ
ncbi:MAG: PA2778 family cysteine peptidase [Desulfobacterales bacterium]|jgi:tetratricopeptide (TPR) repeat protein